MVNRRSRHRNRLNHPHTDLLSVAVVMAESAQFVLPVDQDLQPRALLVSPEQVSLVQLVSPVSQALAQACLELQASLELPALLA